MFSLLNLTVFKKFWIQQKIRKKSQSLDVSGYLISNVYIKRLWNILRNSIFTRKRLTQTVYPINPNIG